tara:strand:+ start:705 stop:1133 length:429 start_codon:yes stop_codon:yes gene_type:complete
MATSQVNGWADQLLTKLSEKAKAYRLATIDKRLAEGVGTTAEIARTLHSGVNVLVTKREKIVADDASVTWTFAKADDGEDIKISATAPSDRGGHTKDLLWIEGSTGKCKKLKGDLYNVDANSLDDTYRETFFGKVTHLGTFW